MAPSCPLSDLIPRALTMSPALMCGVVAGWDGMPFVDRGSWGGCWTGWRGWMRRAGVDGSDPDDPAQRVCVGGEVWAGSVGWHRCKLIFGCDHGDTENCGDSRRTARTLWVCCSPPLFSVSLRSSPRLRG